MPRTIRTGCEASRRHNMPILPYINCPEHLTNLDLWGALYYCAAIPACVLLLLLANGRTLSKTAANKGSNRRRLVIVRRGKAYALKRCRTQMAGNAALRERPGAPAEETALPLRNVRLLQSGRPRALSPGLCHLREVRQVSGQHHLLQCMLHDESRLE